MRILLFAASALALTIGTSSFAQGNRGGGGGGGKPERVQQGGGPGGGQQARGRGNGGGQQAERPRGGGPRQMVQRGGGQERAARGNGGDRQRGPDRVAQRGGPDREMRGNRGSQPEMRGNGGGQRDVRGNGRQRDVANRGPADRGQGRGGPPERMERKGGERMAAPGQVRERRTERLTQRRAAPVANAAEIARLRWDPSQAMGRGCPPGLAAKNNGCLPPGQARKMAEQQNWYSNWWAYPAAANYLYDDGYLVRWEGDDVDSYLPLLGGALWTGESWPSGYEAEPVPDYHLDYFGLQDGYDYQYADGAIFGLDPNTQLIQQVAALVAGDEFAVGQQIPDGYGIYNVPTEYRDQYQDTADANYRYSDGYVYQVDPTTQLIQAAIQLIT